MASKKPKNPPITIIAHDPKTGKQKKTKVKPDPPKKKR